MRVGPAGIPGCPKALVLLAGVALALGVAPALPAHAHTASPTTQKSALAANFAGRDIRRWSLIWFFSTIRARGVGPNQTRIYFRNSRLRFTANGTAYSIAGPDGSITYSAAAQGSRSTYDPATNQYHTVVPLSFSGSVFLTGIQFFVPDGVGLANRTGAATWEGEFYSDTAGTQLDWQWRGRSYRGVPAQYGEISVESTDASRECANTSNNWWYGILCLPIGESLDKYVQVASSSAAPVAPIWDIPRKAPTAIARLTGCPKVGQLAQLDGARSHSGTGRPLKYEWSFESAPDGRLPLLTSADTATPTFVPTVAGRYALQLIVSDDGVRSPPFTVEFCACVPLSADEWTFSMPDSLLLFGGMYSGLFLVGPGGSVDIEPRGRSVPSLSRDGNLVAWALDVPDESAREVPLQVSLHSRKYLETPLRQGLGLYFVQEGRVTTFPLGRVRTKYADTGFDAEVEYPAISPDNSKVAFLLGQRLYLLDTATGEALPLGSTEKSRIGNLTWSPDGSQLAFERGPREDPAIVILELHSRTERALAQGRSPAWSPTGEWIAYFDSTFKECRIIRPDGAGEKVLKTVGGGLRSVFTPWYTFDAVPVWSPDGRKLLLNVYVGETLRLRQVNRVFLLDVNSGRMKRKKWDGLEIRGWATGTAAAPGNLKTSP